MEEALTSALTTKYNMLQYLIFFIGIVVLGDIMLLPLIYFAVTHSLSLPSVLFVGLLAEIAADIMWYLIGFSFNRERVYRFFKLSYLENKSPEIFKGFVQKADKILFISKFLYGIRVPVRVLYGLERISFKNYMKVNFFGSIIWLLLIAGLAYTLDISAEELKLYVLRGEIVFTVFFVLVIVFEIWAKRYIKKFLGSKDQES